MKFGVRKPSIKKSFKARTTSKIERSIKKSVNPIYGNKGIGFAKNPVKSVNNSIYHKTTIGVSDILHSKLNTASSNNTNYTPHINYSNNNFPKKKASNTNKLKIILVILILLLFVFIRGIFIELKKTSSTSTFNEQNTSTNLEKSTIENQEINKSIADTEPSGAPNTNDETNIKNNSTDNNTKSYTYVLNTGTRKFHHSSCSSVKQINSSNYSEFTGTRDEIIGKGYSPCGKCKP